MSAPLSEQEMLAVWEAGQGRHPIERAVLLAMIAAPQRTWDEVYALPLGERDSLLMDLRARLFGETVGMTTPCPACGEGLEIRVALSDLGHRRPEERIPAAPFELVVDGRSFAVRPPASRDLAAIVGLSDPREARARLVSSCVRAMDPGDLSDEHVAAVAAAMLAADPQAEVVTPLRCPACAHESQLLFDSGAFLWEELEDVALHLLLDVGTLARAYHWSEADILALSPTRRTFYLEMATST
jgi:hypothetical protein